jgi:hypothetical protein
MASSTIQLSRTLGVTQQFIRNSPLTFTSPTNNDPGFTNADWVRQFILGPPFAWRWNRSTTNVLCVVGQSDYTISLPTFGWLETATLNDPTNGNSSLQLEISIDLLPDNTPNQPTKISAQSDDGEGNITFRLVPSPDVAYNMVLSWQNASPIFTAATQTWAPIPDYLSYLYNQGMKAVAYEYLADERYVTAMQLFLTNLVSANNGLTESQKAIFLTDRLNIERDNLSVQSTARK